jgi:hypothetical protein
MKVIACLFGLTGLGFGLFALPQFCEHFSKAYHKPARLVTFFTTP